MRLCTIISETGCVFTAIHETLFQREFYPVPVRSIPKNYRSLTGKVIDFRSHSAVAFESALERDLYLLLDFDSAVARFEEQPVTIPYRDPAGVSRTYTPDVPVYYHSELADQQDRQPV